jgi:hypothetical protein
VVVGVVHVLPFGKKKAAHQAHSDQGTQGSSPGV